MNQEWQSFLKNAGAEFSHNILKNFGNPQQERQIISNGDVMSDLSHWAALEVSGEESESFLQNQLTNDLQELQIGNSQLSGWCTPKGRLLVLFRVIKLDNSQFLLLLPSALSESIQKRLQMFVMRSKVTITDRSDSTIRIGLSGPNAVHQLEPLTSTIPADVDQGVIQDHLQIIRLHTASHPRFLLLTQVDQAKEIWSHLDVQSTPISQHPWELLNIRAGLPAIELRTQESFVPQMINLENLNGLSFTKGCYPGQEVVARMQYLGKAKRSLYRIMLHDGAPAAGDALQSPSSSSPQGAGEIVSIEQNGEDHWEGLAVIEDVVSETGDITLESASNIEVLVTPIDSL